jgi:hypothetical protein
MAYTNLEGPNPADRNTSNFSFTATTLRSRDLVVCEASDGLLFLRSKREAVPHCLVRMSYSQRALWPVSRSGTRAPCWPDRKSKVDMRARSASRPSEKSKLCFVGYQVVLKTRCTLLAFYKSQLGSVWACLAPGLVVLMRGKPTLEDICDWYVFPHL